MASPASCAQYSSLVAALRVSTAAPRRRQTYSTFSRVRIPPAARTAPRSLSVSLSVLRPRAHHGASDRKIVEDLSADADADAGQVLDVLLVEDPGECAHDEADAGLVLHVEEPHALCKGTRDDAGLVLRMPTVEEPHEITATTTPGDGEKDVDDDRIVYPSRLTEKDIREYETIDFSRDAIDERFRLESKEARAAVSGAVAGVLSPLRELVHDVRSLASAFDLQEFQIGLPFGAIMTCIGMYQLWKLSPSRCIDVAMYYAFYKLSVIAADVRRRGFSPDYIIRIKLAIIIALIAKEQCNKGLVPLDFVRVAIFFIYGMSVGWDVMGYKKYASSFLPALLHDLKLY